MRDFDATHGIYRRAALKRCQREGGRPRGGFRLPWARCRASAWEGSIGVASPSSPDAVTEDLYETFPGSVAVGKVPFHEFPPTLSRAGFTHQHEPHASHQLR